MQMQTVSFRIRGRSPLMQHNVRLANPINDYAKWLSELNKGRKRKGADKEAMGAELARAEWEGGLYHTANEHGRPADASYATNEDGVGAFLPAGSLLKAIIEGARLSKEGKLVEQGVSIAERRFRIEYDGPRSIEGMWKDGRFCDIRAAKVGQSMVARARPFFPAWEMAVSFHVDPNMCEAAQLERFLATAGAYKGVGEARGGVLGMGRFVIV